MAIIKRQPVSTLRTYLRALGISTLKIVAYNTLALLSVLFVYGNVRGWLYQYCFYALFVCFTFIFAEWTFKRRRLDLRKAAGIALATYAWDVFVSILIWNGFTKTNLFFTQRLTPHLIYFSLHVAVMLFAWYNVSRFEAKAGLTEEA